MYYVFIKSQFKDLPIDLFSYKYIFDRLWMGARCTIHLYIVKNIAFKMIFYFLYRDV